MHIFGPPARFPMAEDRSYTPAEVTLKHYREMAGRLGLKRVVIVQPSVYGADNRCLAAALQEAGKDARGIAGLDEAASDATLDTLDRIGVRGVRINAISTGRTGAETFAGTLQQAAGRISALGWHVQVYADLAQIEAAADAIAASPVPVVVDHFGRAKARLGTAQAGFATLLRLVAGGKVWVKLSGADRLSDDPVGYADMAPLVRALVAANPDRLLWGSDWPHTPIHSHGKEKSAAVSAHRALDDAGLLAALADWLGTRTELQRVLVENPAKLYGFGVTQP